MSVRRSGADGCKGGVLLLRRPPAQDLGAHVRHLEQRERARGVGVVALCGVAAAAAERALHRHTADDDDWLAPSRRIGSVHGQVPLISGARGASTARTARRPARTHAPQWGVHTSSRSHSASTRSAPLRVGPRRAHSSAAASASSRSWRAAAPGSSTSTCARQQGQVSCAASQGRRQCTWKVCEHGSTRAISPSASRSWHTVHSAPASHAAAPPAPAPSLPAGPGAV